MDDLDTEQRRLLADYWWSRAEGEITSWVGFGHVLADLRAAGSPSFVVALAERAVDDEYRHAQWCQDWARRFGHQGGDLRPRSTRPLTFPQAVDSEQGLLRIALCCFTESVGVFTLRHARKVIIDPELKALNRRHLADELQHSRVGWGHLATLDEGAKATLSAWMPKLLSLLSTVCCEGPERDRDDLVPYGYFTPRLLRAAHRQAVEEIIEPGLAHLGVARAA